jgi:hypothetical protein
MFIIISFIEITIFNEYYKFRFIENLEKDPYHKKWFLYEMLSVIYKEDTMINQNYLRISL